MLGVGWDKCTLLHLAEYEAPYRGRRTYDVRLPTGRQAGITTWETTRQLVMHEGDYGQLDEYLEPILAHQGRFRRGPVGAGQAMVAEGEATVREARRWFVRHRDLSAARLLEPYPGVSWEGIGSL
jgi:aminoglycoside 3-N-acetyltransferase